MRVDLVVMAIAVECYKIDGKQNLVSECAS